VIVKKKRQALLIVDAGLCYWSFASSVLLAWRVLQFARDRNCFEKLANIREAFFQSLDGTIG